MKVLSHHVEGARPHEAHESRDARNAHRYRRYDDARIEEPSPPGARYQVGLEAPDPQERRHRHHDRYRHEDERDRHGRRVLPPPLLVGDEEPKRQTDAEADDHRGYRQLRGDPHLRHDYVAYRLADKSQALPEVPLEEAVHVIPVLHEEGPVQPKLIPKALRRHRVVLVAHYHPNGVARAVMSERPGDQPHGQEHDRQVEQPSDDVYPHEPVSPRRSGRSHTARRTLQPDKRSGRHVRHKIPYRIPNDNAPGPRPSPTPVIPAYAGIHPRRAASPRSNKQPTKRLVRLWVRDFFHRPEQRSIWIYNVKTRGVLGVWRMRRRIVGHGFNDSSGRFSGNPSSYNKYPCQ